MTSKASNVNAGLNRLVWKESENSTLPTFALLFLAPHSVKGGLDSIIWAAIQLCMTTGEWYERFSHMSDCQMGSDFRKILNRPKEMNAVCTKVLLQFFPLVCPLAPSIFSQVTPRHVLYS